MTDNTQPEASSTHIIRFALELGLLWIDGSARDKVREALDALDTLEAQLASIGAGGVSALMGAAKAGSEPVATVFTMEALTPGGGVKHHATIHKPLPAGTKLYAAPQPALSAGWRDIATAPKYTEHGAYHHLLLAYAPDEIHEEGFVSQGYWMEAEEDAPDNMGHDGGWVDVHFDFFSCGRSFGAEAYRSAGTQPTHWQPLPTSPSMDGESNADQA